MSQTSPSHTVSDFQSIFNAALKAYEEKTQKDLLTHPLATRLQACNSPSEILTALQDTLQAFDQHRSSDERFSTWLKPTINVLSTLSGPGRVLPFVGPIFTGVGVLLSAVKDADADNLVEFFERIEHIFRRLEMYSEVPSTKAITDLNIKIIVEVLNVLAIVTKDIKQSRTKKYLKRLAGRMDIEDAMKRLDKLTQEQALMFNMQILRTTHVISDRVVVVRGVGQKVAIVGNKIRDTSSRVDVVTNARKQVKVFVQQPAISVGDVKWDRLMANLRTWVSPPDPSTNHINAREIRHGETALWFIQVRDNIFWEWKFTGSLLWICGDSGSGKTILCSTIIDDIAALSEAGSASMAYFYFDFTDLNKQRHRSLLASLLIQLSAQSDTFSDILTRLYSEHGNGTQKPSDGMLTQCLKDMLTIPDQGPLYIIMDALDECPNSNSSGIPPPRQQVLVFLKQLVDLGLPHLHICVTSSPETDIRAALGPLAHHYVNLSGESGQNQDIITYVRSVVRSDMRMKKWRDDDRALVVKVLSEMADGMYRWVFCQLEMLRQCLPASVRRTLQELPESLDETYERVLMGIEISNRDHVHRLLQCLVVATRPLSVDELAELLTLDFDATKGGITKLNEDWRWEDQGEAVLSACSSLISIVHANGSRVVQISHFSVKEFLTSDRLASSMSDISRYHIILDDAHTTLARACLGVLIRDPVDTRGTPRAPYAAGRWVTHARVGDVALRIRDEMEYLFDPDKPYFAAWVQSHDIDNTDYRGRMRNKIQKGAAPLYYAVLCGILDLVEHLAQRHPQHTNAIGGGCGTALHVASLVGHVQAAQLLLLCGADVDVRGPSNRTPLHFASIGGHVDVVHHLLTRDADANPQTDDHNTPLHYAADSGNPDVVRVLLEHKADTNLQDKYGRTPLHGASSRYHSPEGDYPRVVQLLLEHGANPNALDKLHQTPLNQVPSSKLEVARILLENGADVNILDRSRRTPLQVALAKGHDEVAQLLVDYGSK